MLKPPLFILIISFTIGCTTKIHDIPHSDDIKKETCKPIKDWTKYQDSMKLVKEYERYVEILNENFKAKPIGESNNTFVLLFLKDFLKCDYSVLVQIQDQKDSCKIIAKYKLDIFDTSSTQNLNFYEKIISKKSDIFKLSLEIAQKNALENKDSLDFKGSKYADIGLIHIESIYNTQKTLNKIGYYSKKIYLANHVQRTILIQFLSKIEKEFQIELNNKIWSSPCNLK